MNRELAAPEGSPLLQLRQARAIGIICAVLPERRSVQPLVRLACTVALVLSVGCQALPQSTLPEPTEIHTPTAMPQPAWLGPGAYRPAMQPTAIDDVTLSKDPTFYRIDAYVDTTGQPPRVYAIQDTHYTNRTDTPLDAVYFRLFPNKPSYGSALTFEDVTVRDAQAQIQFEVERTALRIDLPSPLLPGHSVDVHMEYDVTVPVDNMRGYGTFNYQDGILLLSNFFAMAAVYDSDGWNLSLAPDYGDPIYAETSFFHVDLTLPPEAVVVTSGSTVERRENDDGTVTWSCVSGPMRDFMVVISERFQSSTLTLGYVRVNSYYLPEHKDGGEQALEYARDCLRAYQQSFAPYPFAEFDVVEAPIFSGGMEYPGMALLGVQYYENGGEYFEFLTAHEVAHQWWYSIVGNDQVNVPWLDESLTNFSIVYYYEYAYGQAHAELAFQSFVAQRYERLQAQGRDGSVAQPVAAFSPDEYGPIVYGKGALFFRELREFLGEELFLDVLRSYYRDRQYKLATPDDFLRVAEQVSEQDLNGLYQQWILESD